MDLSKFRTSVAATKDGVLVDMGEGLKVRIARSGNDNHSKALRKITKPFMRAYQSKTISDDLVMEHSLLAFVGTVLLGWENLTMDGKDVPYSTEKALEILRDPQYADFKTALEGLASEVEVFRNEVVEDIVKN